jgi:ubiquinone/menaquinone biosynthesis C-methylase UbiE
MRPMNERAESTIPVLEGWLGSWRIRIHRRPYARAELRRMYDRYAAWWDLHLKLLGYPRCYETLLRAALERIEPPPHRQRPRVLDCGVGTGALSLAMARASRGAVDLHGVDLSDRMLDRARACLERGGASAVLRRADIRALPYRSDLFDCVMTAHVLEHLSDPLPALREMVRVLRPGGLLVACITRRSFGGLLVQLRWRTHRATPESAQGWLRECGLEQITPLALPAGRLCDWMSVACAGRKEAT